MEVLFVILKIIGILFAVLLLLCVALVLVPVRYRVNVKMQDDIEGKAVVHWLLHLVDLRICYREKEVSYKLRIFGIALPLGKKKESSQKSQGRIKKRKKEKNIPEKSEDLENFIEEKSSLEEEIPTKKEEIQEKGTPGREKKAFSKRRKKRKRKGSTGIFYKIKTGFYNLKHGFRTMVQNFRQRTWDIKNGTTTLKEQIESIKSMAFEETNQKAFFHMLQELKYLLRHYIPGTVSGNVTFSMGNPEQTGKALGTVSLLPFWARSRMIVMPDFLSESFYVKGILFTAGHIRFLHMLISGIRLIADKNIRKLISNIRE